MKRTFVTGLTVAAALMFTLSAFSLNKGKAVRMVDKAYRYYNKNGKTQALKALNKKNGIFHKGAWYVFAWDLNGKVVAHPANHALVGRNVYKLKDADGFQFVKYAVDTAKKKGSGWVSYKWTNPVTKKIGKKDTYFKKVGDIILACGVYE